MRWECRERFPRHRLQRKPLVSDPGMHHDTCVTHVPWCMSGSLTRGGREDVPGISCACTTHNFTYLVRGPCWTCDGTLIQNLHLITRNTRYMANGLLLIRAWNSITFSVRISDHCKQGKNIAIKSSGMSIYTKVTPQPRALSFNFGIKDVLLLAKWLVSHDAGKAGPGAHVHYSDFI